MGIQTYSLTHNKDGSLKNPWEKEFIDFQFDGKYISEFGMVAVFDGDRHTFAASPDFESETTTVNGAAGQLFWGTNIQSLKRTYHLATDGMTEAQVNAFKNHFQPGHYGKFIEDKLAHRYGYCRVSSVINFKVVPFQKQIQFLGLPVMVNEYRGEATITFEWDDPYMYSTINYIEEDDAPTEDKYIDVAKAVYNNGVPLYSSWIGKFYRRYGAELGRAILGVLFIGLSSNITGRICHLGKDKCLSFNGDKENPASELVVDEGHISTGIDDPLIFYNPSNTLTPAIIRLFFQSKWTNVKVSGEWEPVYFNSIADDINWKVSDFDFSYNTIEGTSVIYTQEEEVDVSGQVQKIKTLSIPSPDDFIFQFKYTNPNVLYSINKAISIAYTFYTAGNLSVVELEEKLRKEVVHDKVIKWATHVLRQMRIQEVLCDAGGSFVAATQDVSLLPLGKDMTYAANWFAYFNIQMLMFMSDGDAIQPFAVIFDGKNSETKVIYSHSDTNIDGEVTFFESEEESCGDVILSPYFNLEGGDTVDEQGYISSCHTLQFRQGGLLSYVPHVTLEYDYTYL